MGVTLVKDGLGRDVKSEAEFRQYLGAKQGLVTAGGERAFLRGAW